MALGMECCPAKLGDAFDLVYSDCSFEHGALLADKERIVILNDNPLGV